MYDTAPTHPGAGHIHGTRSQHTATAHGHSKRAQQAVARARHTLSTTHPVAVMPPVPHHRPPHRSVPHPTSPVLVVRGVAPASGMVRRWAARNGGAGRERAEPHGAGRGRVCTGHDRHGHRPASSTMSTAEQQSINQSINQQ